jgi:hypothetical protein
MGGVRTRRLTSGDRDLARTLFSLMAEVFDEEGQPLTDGYVDRLPSGPTSGPSPRSWTVRSSAESPLTRFR